MKFLANENFPSASVAMLKMAGQDIVHVAEDVPANLMQISLNWHEVRTGSSSPLTGTMESLSSG